MLTDEGFYITGSFTPAGWVLLAMLAVVMIAGTAWFLLRAKKR